MTARRRAVSSAAERRHVENVRWARYGVVVGVASLLVTVAGITLSRTDNGAAGTDEAGGLGRVTVEVVYRPSGQNWVVPRALADIGPAPGYEDSYCDSPERISWVRALGGVPTPKNSSVGITISSDSSRVVVVQSVRITTRALLPRVVGTNVALCSGGDAVDAQELLVDLDAQTPRVVHVRPDGKEEADFRFGLNRGDVEFLVLRVGAKGSHSYQWKAEVVLTSAGETKAFEISDEGKAIHTTPAAPDPLFVADRMTGGPLEPCDVMCDAG